MRAFTIRRVRVLLPAFVLPLLSVALLAASASLAANAADYFQAPPAPLVWATPPHSHYSSEVTMATQPPAATGPVEYRFECIAGKGHDSKWQDEPVYTDTGLKPETDYTYVAHVRDKATQKPVMPAAPAFTVRTRTDGHDRVGHIAEIDKAIKAGKIELIPLMITGPIQNRINIVAINRWVPGQPNPYNKPELRETFIEDARHVVKAFDPADKEAIAPYPQYKQFFNVWAVWWPDMPPYDPQHRKTGMHWDDFNEIRARFFLPWTIPGKGWVTQLAMFNSRAGGGGAGRNIEQRVGDAMIAGNKIKDFIHEFSHTAPGCPDEYTSSGLWGRGGEALTTTNESRPDFIPWRKWIEPGTPVPTPYTSECLGKVGLFEGGVHRMAFLFRPTARGCIMGAGSFAGDAPGLCPVCRQGSVMRFYHWVRSVDRAVPAQQAIAIPGPRTVHFAVSRIAPTPDTQKTAWKLNGRVIATGTDEVDVTFGNLPKYELTFELTDETAFIRPDPPFASFPHAETHWTITNTAAKPDDNPLSVTLTPRPLVFAGVNDGTITAEVAGGTPPYTYQWSDGPTVRDRTDLAKGQYTLRVCDSDFRTAATNATIQRKAAINPDIRSEYTKDGWTLTADAANRKSATRVTWSNGTVAPRLMKLADGTYSCTIRNGESGVTRSVTLVKPDKPLAAKVASVIPSSGGDNNGRVTLAVTAGRAPYRFQWSDGVTSASPERHFMPPGKYTVTVTDQNLTARDLTVTIADQPLLVAPKLTFARAADGKVRVSGGPAGCKYLWFANDYPPYLPRFPHGVYTGTFTTPDGKTCKAEAYVIQNKGGLFLDTDRASRNNFGYWISARAFVNGRDAEPMTVEAHTRSAGKAPRVLTVRDQQFGGAAWGGEVADGKLTLQAPGQAGGTFNLHYATRPQAPDKPLCVGSEFAPPHAGNYFIAIQDADTNAISNNRVGFAFAPADSAPNAKPLAPGDARSARLLMWLDASDTDGDGQIDAHPPRRGSIMGWQGKAAGVNFNDFVYYMPNLQNGLGVASWKTIWLQKISKPITGYQTIFMVRKEHSLSSKGTAPWRELSGLIGTGEYGKRLMSRDVTDDIRKGAVYVNGRKVDPFRTPMPTDFYVATYEFAKPVAKSFQRTDGHWEGKIAEVLVFDGKISPAERAGVEAYLYQKWISGI